jgi:hypothetical protein
MWKKKKKQKRGKKSTKHAHVNLEESWRAIRHPQNRARQKPTLVGSTVHRFVFVKARSSLAEDHLQTRMVQQRRRSE